MRHTTLTVVQKAVKQPNKMQMGKIRKVLDKYLSGLKPIE